jgi:hypothetical protein
MSAPPSLIANAASNVAYSAFCSPVSLSMIYIVKGENAEIWLSMPSLIILHVNHPLITTLPGAVSSIPSASSTSSGLCREERGIGVGANPSAHVETYHRPPGHTSSQNHRCRSSIVVHPHPPRRPAALPHLHTPGNGDVDAAYLAYQDDDDVKGAVVELLPSPRRLGGDPPACHRAHIDDDDSDDGRIILPTNLG